MGPTTPENAAGQDPAAEPISSQPEATVPPYSIFSQNQKRWLVLTASLGALFSPISAQIYFPALNNLAKDLDVSSAKINLSVTTYMIIQALSPTMIAGFSDGAGRRPAYIICFAIYIVANIGLALQDNYVALLILRALQSAGSSGTVALATGCIGDLASSGERGHYIAYTAVATVLGPSVGPVIGGVFSEYLGWRSIFWFLTICSVVYFIPLLLFLPETCRKVVGDGSVPAPKINRPLTFFLPFIAKPPHTPTNPIQLAYVKQNYRLRPPNPLSTLRILWDPSSCLILLVTGFSLINFYAIAAGIPSQYARLYGLSDLQLGLVYLPISAGTLLSAFTTGAMLDWNFRRHAKRAGLPLAQKNQQSDLTHFPLERARFEVALPAQLIGGIACVGYGWALTAHTHLAVPLVLIFVMGYGINSTNQCMSALMVDTWPGEPATAAAASNLVRCGLGAAASAAVVPLVGRVGIGWTYSVFAGLFLAWIPVGGVIVKWGPKWRRVRWEREEKREKKEEGEGVT